jgi:signal transduction histidine kinase
MKIFQVEEHRQKMLIYIIGTYLLSLFLLTAQDMALTGLVNDSRQMLLDLGEDSLNATMYGMMASIGIGCIGAVFTKKQNKWLKMGFVLVASLSLLSVIHLVNRTGLVICASCLFVGYVLSTRMNVSKMLPILLVFIVVAIVLQFKMLSRQITLAQLKENLTSFFTHELRSPLQSALSSIEMAEMYSEKSEVNNFLELSRNKVIYINRLIEKLLDINKLEKNKVNLIKENFPFMESISQYLNHYFNRSDKNIEIEPLFDPAMLIYGDKIHISNAMGNLIENAVKYSSDSVHIKIYAEENPHYITIIVEDNGIGIAPADQKRIFERFYRVKSAEHATKGKGFGLGLNYVKWVALSHKGDVKVESTPGKGSKFFFTVKKG